MSLAIEVSTGCWILRHVRIVHDLIPCLGKSRNSANATHATPTESQPSQSNQPRVTAPLVLDISATRTYPFRSIMSDATDTKEKVKTFILNEFLPDSEPDELEDDTPLRSGGILNSIATLRLTSFLEEEFDIKIEAHEMGEFDTVEEIVALVTEKQ